MSAKLRTKHGCWTCKLRRKKCDEGRGAQGQCATCSSLSLTCYGYGEKPDWMGDEKLEKAIVDGFKQTVKQTSRRKNTIFSSGRRMRPVPLVPKSSTRKPPSPLPMEQPEVSTSGQDSSLESTNSTPNPCTGTVSTVTESHRVFDSPDSMLSSVNSVHLMHYMDAVIPLQWPMWTPDILEGGRGWLLDLVLRTKPLFHAALALSSYHRLIMVTERVKARCLAVAVEIQERHLGVALAEVRQAIQATDDFVGSSQSLVGMGTVASIVNLLFLEVFTCGNTAWRMHLHAATNLYSTICADAFGSVSPSDTARLILQENQPLPIESILVVQDVVAFRFFGGTIIWLDIIAAITSGEAPKLSSHHNRIIAADSPMKLERVMGCRNWVMRQIGRIAALHMEMAKTRHHGPYDVTLFEESIRDIQHEIESGLSHESLRVFNISDRPMTGFRGVGAEPKDVVTIIFAHMATVYLHLVHHGFKQLDLVRASISQVITLVQREVPANVLPALVAPLFILGCASKIESDKECFRELFSSTLLLDRFLKRRAKILPVLEEIWKETQSRPEFSWGDAITIAQGIFLF
ncbi:fungal-specific transcription factor domain-containing protein [Xylariaceae sp. FL0255]|nr:fungal-specific transcription factor domain-containing protein [Xylariaceae sp. FL0255]